MAHIPNILDFVRNTDIEKINTYITEGRDLNRTYPDYRYDRDPDLETISDFNEHLNASTIKYNTPIDVAIQLLEVDGNDPEQFAQAFAMVELLLSHLQSTLSPEDFISTCSKLLRSYGANINPIIALNVATLLLEYGANPNEMCEDYGDSILTHLLFTLEEKNLNTYALIQVLLKHHGRFYFDQLDASDFESFRTDPERFSTSGRLNYHQYPSPEILEILKNNHINPLYQTERSPEQFTEKLTDTLLLVHLFSNMFFSMNNVPISPRLANAHLKQNIKAVLDHLKLNVTPERFDTICHQIFQMELHSLHITHNPELIIGLLDYIDTNNSKLIFDLITSLLSNQSFLESVGKTKCFSVITRLAQLMSSDSIRKIMAPPYNGYELIERVLPEYITQFRTQHIMPDAIIALKENQDCIKLLELSKLIMIFDRQETEQTHLQSIKNFCDIFDQQDLSWRTFYLHEIAPTNNPLSELIYLNSNQKIFSHFMETLQSLPSEQSDLNLFQRLINLQGLNQLTPSALAMIHLGLNSSTQNIPLLEEIISNAIFSGTHATQINEEVGRGTCNKNWLDPEASESNLDPLQSIRDFLKICIQEEKIAAETRAQHPSGTEETEIVDLETDLEKSENYRLRRP